MCYKIASKTKISVTTVKSWPKSQKIPLISEKTQANPKKNSRNLAKNSMYQRQKPTSSSEKAWKQKACYIGKLSIEVSRQNQNPPTLGRSLIMGGWFGMAK